MEDTTIVLYSIAEHLNSISVLATLISNHNPSISVVLLSTAADDPVASTAVTYRRLPTPDFPPNSDPVELIFEIPRLNNPYLLQALQEISQKSRIKAAIIDVFCNPGYEVFTSLNIPTYFCYTSGAFWVCIFLQWPDIHEPITADSEELVDVPGCPLIHPSDLPKNSISRAGNFHKHILDATINMRKSDGIIVNTFRALEFRAMEAISNGLCVPDGPTPPVYPVGPLIAEKIGGEEHECLRWLDRQPSKSVVFLCFGRAGVFSAKQIKETAIGLENSGYRFLWAVRSGLAEEPDLDSLLPEGFLERTKERGVVLKNWAPQIEVLSHEAVGAFVTHCGQSSILEAVMNGVPMIGWPLYAEQRSNRVFMVEEMKVAVALEEAEGGFVTAGELEKRVRKMMEERRGREIRRRVTEMKYSAAAAVGKGGSSVAALEKCMEAVTRV